MGTAFTVNTGTRIKHTIQYLAAVEQSSQSPSVDVRRLPDGPAAESLRERTTTTENHPCWRWRRQSRTYDDDPPAANPTTTNAKLRRCHLTDGTMSSSASCRRTYADPARRPWATAPPAKVAHPPPPAGDSGGDGGRLGDHCRAGAPPRGRSERRAGGRWTPARGRREALSCHCA